MDLAYRFRRTSSMPSFAAHSAVALAAAIMARSIILGRAPTRWHRRIKMADAARGLFSARERLRDLSILITSQIQAA
jgi:hypothetical protein